MKVNKKVLIFGGSGMLGHKLWQLFADRFDTYVTLRGGFRYYERDRLFDRMRTLCRVSAQDFDSVTRAVAFVRPQVVVNCIGIVKQAPTATDPIASISVNALFPHRLARVCATGGIRLIHISTDCVFSGRKGNYLETDMADAEDLYGRTKYLGEVDYNGCLTLRTSIIGRELGTSHGLMEWFFSQQGGTVHGYKRAVFSGVTTNVLAEIIARIIAECPGMEGVWHVASDPISKFDLLSLVRQVYDLNVHIEPDETVTIDRSLNGSLFRQATGIVPPSWVNMIEQMSQDPMTCSELRRSHDNW